MAAAKSKARSKARTKKDEAEEAASEPEGELEPAEPDEGPSEPEGELEPAEPDEGPSEPEIEPEAEPIGADEPATPPPIPLEETWVDTTYAGGPARCRPCAVVVEAEPHASKWYAELAGQTVPALLVEYKVGSRTRRALVSDVGGEGSLKYIENGGSPSYGSRELTGSVVGG